MIRARLSPRAENDLGQICDYIASDNPEAARQEYRNYLIFYQPFKDSIVVIRILHAAQDWTQVFPITREKAD
jgi:plasmid stabilization system protein ParE